MLNRPNKVINQERLAAKLPKKTPAPTRKKTFKRRNNYTDIDDSMISYFFYEVGLSIMEINKVTDMCLGSISWRVKKDKLKYPNRRRNTDITAEWLDELKKAWLKDRSHREILEAVKHLTIRNE
ncbi:hypothetical protein BC941DRAFT_473828 [Chlamydoabsidia padenii]|nr:hypothetical protein BC941DRAFT_473828 [Chlamydoabsidia padenii]